ncbi:hypothetical protein CS022_05665 [Veronia nyctiphanis]|uniref:Uncharacterized protein n=1 Tax=Veronia nyctiphanis TaxID=1278244 RepID=A0A4Q0YV75_9GAMM|nr:hypothetical protein [Veronia nyctiphanis]RXJ74114.1 hypothetical protein CS022_05665 [Veronia nyctiphanis]
MKYLGSIDAAEHSASKYRSLKKKYVYLFREVEAGDINDATKLQSKFLVYAQKLEVEVATKVYIEPLEASVKALKRKRTDDKAPASFLQLEAALEMASYVVKSTPRDVERIKALVAKSTEEMSHVKNVAAEVRTLQSLEDEEFEAYVLSIEDTLQQIAAALDAENMRSLTISEVGLNLASMANDLRTAGSDTQPLIDDLKEQLADAKGMNDKLNLEVLKLNDELESLSQGANTIAQTLN